jgi:hypothetical protein
MIAGQTFPLSLNMFSNPNTSCMPCTGDASVVPGGGTSPYLYSWSTGESNAAIGGLCAGSYTVIVTDDNGCTSSTAVSISGPAGPTAGMSANPASCSSCPDGDATITPSGGTAPYTFSWSTGDTGANATGLAPGTYTVCVTDANACQVCDTVQVGFLTGITSGTASGFSVSPNPATDVITIALPSSGTADVRITDILGAVVYRGHASGTSFSVPVDGLPAGTYFLIVDGSHASTFIKQ